MKTPRGGLERVLLLFALTLPLSISAAQLAFAVALLWWIADRIRRRSFEPRWGPYAIPAGAFILIAAASACWSVRPEVSLARMHRLAFPVIILMMDDVWGPGPTASAGRGRVIEPVLAFVMGCVILALSDVVRVPREVAAGADIATTGNMRDPQMYLTALCLLAAIAMPESRRPWRPFYLPGFLFNGLGVVLHFKRGVWIGLVAALGAMGWRAGRRRTLALLGVALAAALAVPAVRLRILDALQLREDSVGGRAALWRHAAPALIKEFPHGMGWSAVAHEDLAARTPFLQDNLNHLHNNFLQIVVETGWVGLAAWTVWMITALVVMGRTARGPPDHLETTVGLGVWAAFLGLMINGLFEYNFGDTEVLMLLCFLMGLSFALYPAGDAR